MSDRQKRMKDNKLKTKKSFSHGSFMKWNISSMKKVKK